MRHFVSIVIAGVLASGCNRAALGEPVSTASPLSASVASSAPSAAPPALPGRVAAILAEPDRSAEDRALDESEQGGEVLAYLDVNPGMSVADLASGAGYFAELLARSVGTEGRVLAENPPSLLARRGLGSAWDARLTHRPGARVVRVDAELGIALPLAGLDLVYAGDDLGELDVGSVNAGATEAWGALREGGRFVVMLRTENEEARRLIQRCGFQLVREGRFLRDGEHVLLTFAKPEGAR